MVNVIVYYAIFSLQMRLPTRRASAKLTTITNTKDNNVATIVWQQW